MFLPMVIWVAMMFSVLQLFVIGYSKNPGGEPAPMNLQAIGPLLLGAVVALAVVGRLSAGQGVGSGEEKEANLV